ncbi:unnamed protein product [Rotaria sp. Silwood2]|nr:unnamed protein product [Rotaria sp. Silwood2]CAF4562779.1 unnamed protein product [Rotaria sp. Silwood2]
MICLLAPIANEASETDLIRQLRTGVYNALLPETSEELRQMIHTQTVKRPKLPGPFVNGFLHLRLLLTSLLEYDSSRIEDHYQQLRLVNFPALILWGRQDKVYAVSGAEFFHNLLPNSKCVIFDDCGHFLAIDKPEETARNKYNDVEPISTDLSSEQVLNPFQCSYRCRVLYHYPPEVPNNTFDEDTISRLSMPDGVSIRQNSSDPSTTHPFLIARFDGTRYYAVALTFSEQINNDDKSLTESLSTSSSSSSTTINSLNRLIENYNRTCRQQRRSSSLLYSSKAICLIGPQAHYSTFKRILELLYRMTIEHDLLGLPFEAHLYNILHE